MDFKVGDEIVYGKGMEYPSEPPEFIGVITYIGRVGMFITYSYVDDIPRANPVFDKFYNQGSYRHLHHFRSVTYDDTQVI